MRKKTILKAVCVILPIVGLGFMLRKIGWTQVAAAVSPMHAGWLALLLAMAVLESVVDGIGLWIATGKRARPGFGIAVNAAGAITNLILPFEAGEILKGTLLRGRIGAQAAVSGTLVWNYLFKLTRPLVSLVATSVGVLFYALPDRQHTAIILVCGAVAFLPYAGLRVLIRYGATQGFLRLVGRLPFLGRLSPKWIDTAGAVDIEVRRFGETHPGEYHLILATQLIGRLIGWGTIHVLLLCLGINQGFALSSLVFALLTIGDYLAALMPARIGVSEGSTYFLFQFLALPAPLGVLLYALLRLRTLAGSLALLPLGFLGENTPPRDVGDAGGTLRISKRPCP